METSEYILETVAPIFNRKGYVGTSLSDLTKATGLTKGALYGNFSNKEDLALQAFRYNIKQSIRPMYDFIGSHKKAIDRLYAITAYQRKYYDRVIDQGGCPIIRVGIDAKFISPALFRAAKRSMQKFLKGIRSVMHDAVAEGSLDPGVDIPLKSKLIYTMIEGSLVAAFTHHDRSFIDDTMDYIDHHIIPKLLK